MMVAINFKSDIRERVRAMRHNVHKPWVSMFQEQHVCPECGGFLVYIGHAVECCDCDYYALIHPQDMAGSEKLEKTEAA